VAGIPSSIHGQQKANARRSASLHQALERQVYEKKIEAVRRRLELAGNRYIVAVQEMETIVAERDAAIIEASCHRLPRRYVALATGLTPGRVQQIVDARGHAVSTYIYTCTQCGHTLAGGTAETLPPCPTCGGVQWSASSSRR
jgi:rubrerythrin